MDIDDPVHNGAPIDSNIIQQTILTTELSGEHWSIQATDLLTGTTQGQLKITASGGACKPRTLTRILDDYVVAAENDKSLIYFWTFGGRSDPTKVVCPGRVTALTTCSRTYRCFVGIGEKIYIWQMSSGALLDVLERHYQPVTVLRCSSTGHWLVSGAEDGLVLAWYLPNITRAYHRRYEEGDPTMAASDSDREAKHVWRHHQEGVTDVALGMLRVHCKVASVSKDRTCQIYQLNTGVHLATIIFDQPLYSVVMDPKQSKLFCGADDGRIFETQIRSAQVKQLAMPLGTSATDQDNKLDQSATFVGHKGKVTCLSVSIDGQALVSGSADQTVKLWHIIGKYCKRTVQHKGPIGNVLVMSTPLGLSSDRRPDFIPRANYDIQSFRHGFDPERPKLIQMPLRCDNHKRISTDNVKEGEVQQLREEVTRLREENAKIRMTNKRLYEFALNDMLTRNAQP